MPWTEWDSTRLDLDAVASAVRTWVDHVPDSPLYSRLALGVSEDRDLLRVVARIDNVPPMNILLGAVKYLLSPADALAAWYPHLTSSPREADDAAVAALREFVLEHTDEIAQIGRTRRTQTNEIGRCSVILPWLVESAAGWEQPAHAVDIGASAGLNLMLDMFAYRYGDHSIGSGPVVLECDNRGGFDLPTALPRLATRTGLDLEPVDATDPDSARWLAALIWPEHTARLARLDAAIELRKDADITMVPGDAVTTLAELDAGLPEGPMLVWHTIALYQFSAEQRAALDDVITDIATRRPVARVGLEPTPDGPYPQVRVGLSFDRAAPVAVAHPHGSWLARPPAPPP